MSKSKINKPRDFKFTSEKKDTEAFMTTSREVDSKKTIQEEMTSRSTKTTQLKRYVVDLKLGQLAKAMLKPNTTITLAVGDDGNIYPECFRSLVNAEILKIQD